MTDLEAQFVAAHPKAIDFSKEEYEARKEKFDQAATQAGYRLAGIRLGRAVFTTKDAG